jgi:hypothetical protein
MLCREVMAMNWLAPTLRDHLVGEARIPRSALLLGTFTSMQTLAWPRLTLVGSVEYRVCAKTIAADETGLGIRQR